MVINEELEIELSVEELEELIRDLPRILCDLNDDKSDNNCSTTNRFTPKFF